MITPELNTNVDLSSAGYSSIRNQFVSVAQAPNLKFIKRSRPTTVSTKTTTVTKGTLATTVPSTAFRA